jgi:hypothetical protein
MALLQNLGLDVEDFHRTVVPSYIQGAKEEVPVIRGMSETARFYATISLLVRTCLISCLDLVAILKIRSTGINHQARHRSTNRQNSKGCKERTYHV